ncbi:hypothetical protein CP336_06490 [Pseudomonas fluorescens]|nr:hypothetical protein CP336_06490 [Pseudomonas fluorescens]
MGKHKDYVRIDLSTPQIGKGFDYRGGEVVAPEAIPPAITLVKFGRNTTTYRSFDFAPWYGLDIDPITYACQRQIEHFLAIPNSNIEVSTVTRYCTSGLCRFFDFLALRATALRRELTQADIDRELIDSFIGHLAGMRVSAVSQRNYYNSVKPVLLALGQLGVIALVDTGDTSTFPRNPFPNSNRKVKGETPLPKAQRQAFAQALKQAVMPIWCDDVPLTSKLLTYALFIVALHTGRNTTSLLEMKIDCLRPHPKDNTAFLTLLKRRGHNTSKVILRSESTNERILEVTPTVKTNVERLIRHVIARTEPLRAEASDDLKAQIWLYQSRERGEKRRGKITALSKNSLLGPIQELVIENNLTDIDGQPLKINISRLRKTFANRIFELLDGDLATTAIALGNTPTVAGRNYLLPNEDSKCNWRFMGEILVEELLTCTIGSTYKTPMGHCSDPVHGQYAPKRDGAKCMNFLHCIRCQHYAVTENDLYKLFSFYFRIFEERSRMDKRRWAREFAHIPRLIDDYIVAEGLRRRVFRLTAVEAARERARKNPHPFWSTDMVSHLEIFV